MPKETDKKQAVARDDTIAIVIDLMRRLKKCTRTELAEASGLVRSTITNIVDTLIRAGLVLETGFISQNRGRRSIQITLNSDKLVALGISVTHNYYGLALVDIFGKVRAKEEHFFPGDFTKGNIPAIFETIADTAERFLKKNGAQPIGLGLALPGPYLINEKKILLLTETGWKKYSFIETFERRFHIPTVMERDANAGAMGEWWFGKSAAEHGAKMFVSTGTGIGAGIVVDGTIFRGESGTPGEIGHMCINYEGPKCDCGNRGCLEMYCSKEEIICQVNRQLTGDLHTGRPQPLYGFDDIVSEYHSENPTVLQVVNNAAKLIGMGLANLIYLYDPGLVIIGGPLSRFGDKFLEAVKTSVKKHMYPFFHEKVAFMLSSLVTDSVLIGASAVVFDRLLRTPTVLIDKNL